MKKLLAFSMVFLLVFGLILSLSGPVVAQGNKPTKVTDSFSVDQSSPGYKIPHGSIIRHLENGITEVYKPDNSLMLTALDTDSTMVATPSGLARATHVYVVPSGSEVACNGNTTNVYENDTLILTVVDSGSLAVPQFSGWIEQANNWSVSNLNYFSANWNVPSNPPDQNGSEVDFFFNAIEPQSGNAIIQPVLEWNQAGSHGWTLRAWYGPDKYGNYYCSTPITAATNNSISGVMSYNSWLGWQITCRNNSTSRSTSIRTRVIGTNSIAVFCAFEAYNVNGNNDVPGTTTFNSMSFKYNNNNVNMTWNPYIDLNSGLKGGLTGLGVEIISSSKVILHTANK